MSVRAAAQSAVRAGLWPWCADRFADQDLSALCPVEHVAGEAYPAGLVEAAERGPAGPWIYTGPLENHPELVDRLARSRPLWGVGGEALRAVRQPRAVADALDRAGLPCPRVRLEAAGLPRDGSWLVKPLASGGGQGIAPLTGETQAPSAGHYFQERIDGLPLSALFLGRRQAGASLLGLTWQWVGRPGAPFGYRGSVGPYPVSEALRQRVSRLGRALAWAFGLVGLFGVDLVVREGQPWPIEVNPRYTASGEVLELATGRALLPAHARACGRWRSRLARAVAGRPGVVGKAVVFAEAAITFPAGLALVPTDAGPFTIPSVADIPRPGTRFAPGQPVLTVFATATSVAACRAELDRRLAQCQARLEPLSAAGPAPASLTSSAGGQQ